MRRDLKDFIGTEKRLWRRSSNYEFEDFKRDGQAEQRCRGLKVEKSRKPSRKRQPSEERDSQRRSGVGDVGWENEKGAIDERKGGRNWGRCSSMERRKWGLKDMIVVQM